MKKKRKQKRREQTAHWADMRWYWARRRKECLNRSLNKFKNQSSEGKDRMRVVRMDGVDSTSNLDFT
jgi:hypothetical protein